MWSVLRQPPLLSKLGKHFLGQGSCHEYRQLIKSHNEPSFVDYQASHYKLPLLQIIETPWMGAYSTMAIRIIIG